MELNFDEVGIKERVEKFFNDPANKDRLAEGCIKSLGKGLYQIGKGGPITGIGGVILFEQAMKKASDELIKSLKNQYE